MKKMDEMQLYISAKSIKIAYIYTLIFLVVWMIYEYINTGKSGLPSLLIITQNLVLMGSMAILNRRMGCKGTLNFYNSILFIAIFIAVIVISIGMALLLKN